ncbi:MAG: hypothetical protein CFH10_00473 [Alphaproteobacteria bacterium MarineAlpha4_Bin2]|nr:MAG: hypothetical protein CFH10_00473 [Alphaproteobacteria bacterium MarineAlpha4_Bin2]|tara:strand:- start:392 stop:862 length:471 start_codon:yes stop_codon:yes gene_type:complete
MFRQILNLTHPLFVLILLGTACAKNEPLSPTKSASTPAGQSQQFRPVSDVPIPKDATLDAERSLILSGTEDWTGRLVMTSSITPTEAFGFYKTEMPRFAWDPMMTVQSAVSVLSFTRDGRAAAVQIEPRALGGTLITVTVARAQESSNKFKNPPLK